MSEGKDDESLSIGDLDGVASGYVYDTGESVEVIDNEGNVVESFALNKRSLTRRLPSPLPTVVALQAQGHWFEPSIAHQKTRGRRGKTLRFFILRISGVLRCRFTFWARER